MTTLLDIQSELLELESQIEELPPEQAERLLEEWLTAYGRRNEKLDGYARLITELEARSKARREESQRLSKRAQIDESKSKLLRESLQNFFTANNLKSIETDRHRLTLAKNSKRPMTIHETIGIPDEYLTAEPDRSLIRKALENGETLNFATLGAPTYSIRIK